MLLMRSGTTRPSLQQSGVCPHGRRRHRVDGPDVCKSFTMSGAVGLFVVKLPDFVRTTTFRWTSIAFVVCILLFSAFVYWEAAAYMIAKMDDSIAEESLAIAADTPDRQLIAI